MFCPTQAVSLWLLAFAPGDGDVDSKSIAVAPVTEVKGAEDPIEPARLGGAIIKGLERGDIQIEPLAGDCKDQQCWIDLASERGTSYVLIPEIEVDGPDHRMRLDVFDVASQEKIASTDGLCEICGEDEVVASTGDVAAQLIPRLERLAQQPARLVLDGRPPGATVEIDGEVVGTLPWEGEVGPGEHTLRLSSDGYVPLSQTIAVSPGVQEIAELELMPRPDDGSKPRTFVVAGASLAAVGVVGVGLGVGLFVLDGRPFRRDCPSEVVDVNGRCPQMYEATAPAVTAVVVGGAALVTGAVLLIRGLRKGNGRVPSANAFRPTARGLALRF